ncbi:MAG: 4a-hydroxytetrahydrobiopterin dehydratase [Candidatus Saccharimonadales bacterium]
MGADLKSSWQETKHGLYKRFVFDNFRKAFEFMSRVAVEAERMQHHPRWQNEWNEVDIWLSTHDAGMQITDKDHQLADAIDRLESVTVVQPVDSNDVKKSTVFKELKLFADGGSRGNPGPSSSGYVLLDMSDNVLINMGVYLGITTNNQAEYQALKFGLEESLKHQARTVHVYMDSMLVVNQMKGIFKVKNRDLWPIHEANKELVKKFEKVTFDHVPRELNKLADAEVNLALDEALKNNPEQ